MEEEVLVRPSASLLNQHVPPPGAAPAGSQTLLHVGDGEAEETTSAPGPGRAGLGRAGLGRAGPVWASQCQPGPVWSSLGLSGPAWSSQNQSKPVWASLKHSGPVWAGLNQSGPVWTSLGWSEPPRITPLSVSGRVLQEWDQHISGLQHAERRRLLLNM